MVTAYRLATPALFAGIIAVVTFQTGRGHQVDRMTVGTSGTVVLEAVAFPTAGMRLVE